MNLRWNSSVRSNEVLSLKNEKLDLNESLTKEVLILIVYTVICIIVNHYLYNLLHIQTAE